jgi:hypothetical protein
MKDSSIKRAHHARMWIIIMTIYDYAHTSRRSTIETTIVTIAIVINYLSTLTNIFFSFISVVSGNYRLVYTLQSSSALYLHL